jgi:hypothetical protein
MGLGFDWDALKDEWDHSKRVLDGTEIYNPMTKTYVPIKPEIIPQTPPDDLTRSGPNSTEARLAHIEILVANGSISAQDGAEARARVLQGL